jgi:quinol monooxygenase YgiN
MPTILRHVIVRVSPDLAGEVERLWKEQCAPLMLRRPGCLREELLRCREEPGEYISVAEWASQEAIDAYLASEEHRQIVAHTRGLTGAAATVKTYELVG